MGNHRSGSSAKAGAPKVAAAIAASKIKLFKVIVSSLQAAAGWDSSQVKVVYLPIKDDRARCDSANQQDGCDRRPKLQPIAQRRIVGVAFGVGAHCDLQVVSISLQGLASAAGIINCAPWL